MGRLIEERKNWRGHLLERMLNQRGCLIGEIVSLEMCYETYEINYN